MCGRIVWVWDPLTGELVAKYDDQALEDDELAHLLKKERYNVPPTAHLPIIVHESGKSRVAAAHWGFPLPGRPTGVFNTRIERAVESNLWRGLIGKHHALFIVQGFYEWQRQGTHKVPHYVHRADGRPMVLAGLVGWARLDREMERCGSIVTCPPNERMMRLHDRMPVILEEGAEADRWLDPEGHGLGLDEVLSMARPSDAELEIVEVSRRVNSTDNDDADLIDPDKREGGRQTRLFGGDL